MPRPQLSPAEIRESLRLPRHGVFGKKKKTTVIIATHRIPPVTVIRAIKMIEAATEHADPVSNPRYKHDKASPAQTEQ